ncbi:MAG: hypothetical protein KAY22_07980 [Rhizorhabdus sp.]|uniref:hypothetical protein n=1 Tax=Rhizorhabdus sp. TaxID=1968843 RepID=UPI001B758B56|nr:hypothetical protein [Rhizorhabdus sp.]MBP8232226.1 hypothetical protein [Rhizorhabdus sp.]
MSERLRDTLKGEGRTGNFSTLAGYLRHIIDRRAGTVAVAGSVPDARVPVLLVGAADQELIRACVAQFRMAGVNLNTLLRDLHVARLDARTNVDFARRIEDTIGALESNRKSLYDVLEMSIVNGHRRVR